MDSKENLENMGDGASTSAAEHELRDEMDPEDQEEMDRIHDEGKGRYNSDVVKHNGLWMEYVTGALSGQNQEGLFIAPNQATAISSVKWHLVAPLQVLITRKNNCRDPERKGNPFHAVQVLKFNVNDSQTMDVRCACPSSKGEIFQLGHEDIVARKRVLKGKLRQLVAEIQAKAAWIPKNLIYPIDSWEKLRDSFNESAFQMIKKGMILEMQMEEDPRVVTIAEVVKNYRGLLMVKFGRDYIRHLHMTSPYIHEIGWVGKMEKDGCHEMQLVPGRADDRKRAKIPESTVWKNGFIRNRLKQNEIVVFLDHDRRNFYFAHVHLIENSTYFFHLIVGKHRVRHPKTKKPMLFHMSHDHIFSYKTLRSARVQVKLPPRFTKPLTDTKDYEDLVLVYIRHFVRKDTTLALECIGAGWEYHLLWEDIDSDRKNLMIQSVTSLQYVEIFLPNKLGLMQIHAAKVLKAHFFLLTLSVPGREGAVYAHPYDRSIYQFGTAKDWSESSRSFRSVLDEEDDN